MNGMNQWWGYLHVLGSTQAKRYFSQEDITEAHESDFVEQVVGPFPANDREEALSIVNKLTKERDVP